MPPISPRRLRYHPHLRDLVRETTLTNNDFIQPLFIKHGFGVKEPIASMPGCFRYSVDTVIEKAVELQALGIKGILLFGIPAHKDTMGSSGTERDGVVQEAIRAIKRAAPALLVIADVCLCEYTDHGHCGLVEEKNGSYHVDNNSTLPVLANQAISLAAAGADVIAPSGMMDGMVAALRTALDRNGFTDLPILSYSVKYASAFYGPFREAADGAPQFGDRRSYQMDPANSREALKEATIDIEEGADMLMVKPAHTYLDVISQLRALHPSMPLFAYHTSGEYAMLEAAIINGWISSEAIGEVMLAIKRAGADVIITYYAEYMVRALRA
jgi:porphobilinogen synthase